MPSPETSAPTPPARSRRWASWLVLAALFAVALTLFTRHNDYPYYYHPDEYGKARQIVDGTKTFNFNHPLLLLNVAKAVSKLLGKPEDQSKPSRLQHATVGGRTASAIFAAVAVVALVAASYLLGGIGGACAAAIALLFHPLLFEHAHIFKEDPALVMGLSLTAVAALMFWKSPASSGRAVFLGVAAALAISGKYLGAAALVIALPVVLLAPGEKRARRLGIFFAAFVLTFALANRQMFTHLAEWRASFDREFGYSMKGGRGLVAQDSAGYYLHWFRLTVPTAGLIFLAFNALNLVTTARRRSIADWLVFLFPFAFAAVLMTSPRISDRYFLPAAVLFNFNALVGVGVAAEWFTRAFGKLRLVGQIAFAALALLIGWRGQFSQFQKTYAQFQVDDRRDLEAWMSENLPPGSQIAQDSSVGLPDPDHHKQKGMQRAFKHEVLGSEFVPDLGTLDELRAKGVRYIATTPKKSQRYTSGAMMPSDEVKEEFERRKAFYSALPQQAKLVWNRPMLEIDTLHPGLDLYDLGGKP